MIAVEVRERSQVAEARWRALDAARTARLAEEDAARAALIATEAGTNLLKHAGGGEMLIAAWDAATRGRGMDIVALDAGPGIADVGACFADGYSTTGSAGCGLGALRRQADRLDLWSQPGCGSAVVASVAPRERSGPGADAPAVVEGLAVPVRGESACGDAWCWRRIDGLPAVMVCDGLGHGRSAAAASARAVAAFAALAGGRPEDWLAEISPALKGTRGAAVALMQVDLRGGLLRFVGVGNIAGLLRTGAGEQRLLSVEGIVGPGGYRAKPMEYPLHGGALTVLSSDGLATRWRLSDYRGLAARDPLTVAGVLYRDFRRPRDDCCVVVGRWGEE